MRIVFGFACMILTSSAMCVTITAEKKILKINGSANITGNVKGASIMPFGGEAYIDRCASGKIRIYITENGRYIYDDTADIAGKKYLRFPPIREQYVGRKVTVNYVFHDVSCTMKDSHDFFGVELINRESPWSEVSNISFKTNGWVRWEANVSIRSSVDVADVLELKIGQCSEIYANLSGQGVVSLDVPNFINTSMGDRLPVRLNGRTLCLDYPAEKPNGGKYQGVMRVSLGIP